MAMPKPFKHPKTGIFWFRRGVPKDCQKFVGKTAWNQTLKTSSKFEAEKRIIPYIAETDKLISDIRDGQFRLFKDDQLQSYVNEWVFRQRIPITQSGSVDNLNDIDDLPKLTDEQAIHGLESVLKMRGVQIEPGSPDHDRLVDMALQAIPMIRTRPAWVQKSKPEDQSGALFMAVFESYISEAQPREKTAGEFRKSIKDFLAIHGGDMPVRAVTKAMIVEYKDLLLRKPRNLSWKQRELNLRDLVEQVQSDDTISATTVKKALTPINAAFEYAIANDLVEVNPASGFKVTRPKNAGPKRLPYSVADMNRIFASPHWSKSKREERYWLPLLALWTGARVEELAQLYVSDIQNQDGIDFINIAEIGEGQKLKNLSSIRRVPMHPELVRLGFLDYVRKRGNAKMLFDIKPYRRSKTEIKYAHYFSKWWYELCREKLGITNPKLVFHSFRHSFKDAGREAGLDKAIVDALQGHSDGSVSGGYGSGYPLVALDRAMSQIRFPGLLLSI